MSGIMKKIEKAALKILRELKGKPIGYGAWVAAVRAKDKEFKKNTTDGVVRDLINESEQHGIEKAGYGKYRWKTKQGDGRSLPVGRMRFAIDAALNILKKAQGKPVQRKQLLEDAWDKIEKNPPNKRPVGKSASDAAIDGHVLAAYWREQHKIEQVGHGLYRMTAGARAQGKGSKPAGKSARKNVLDEKEFCEPFARHLVNELGECTMAAKAGKPTIQLRWANPDVVGVFKPPSPVGHFNFPTQIVAVEIKSKNSAESRIIEAFGQACAYKAFAHKAYVVVPNAEHCSDADIGRLEYLCNESGIGLCLFDPTDKGTDFDIRVRARSHNPDPVFVNIFIQKLEKSIKKELGLE